MGIDVSARNFRRTYGYDFRAESDRFKDDWLIYFNRCFPFWVMTFLMLVAV